MKDNFVFQIDHPAVLHEYNKDNYKIIFDEQQQKKYCTLYFSSHSIYFPNEEMDFNDRIISRDAYEWFKSRVSFSHKHIFLRDIFKQWYLEGINSIINSPEKLLGFLREQTRGYKIITIGASAGGYAAVLYGASLGAERILSFNGQMELESLLNKSSESTDPLLFRLQGTPLRKYYDLKPFINDSVNIYYFYSKHSEWDAQQAQHVANLPIHFVPFNIGKHGIPFLKCSLPKVISLGELQLKNMTKAVHHPLIFSIIISGYINVAIYCSKQTWKILMAYIKRREIK